MVEPELMKRMNQDISGRGMSRNRKNVPRSRGEKSRRFYGVVQVDKKGHSGKQSWKCRLGPALGRSDASVQNLDFVGNGETLNRGDM